MNGRIISMSTSTAAKRRATCTIVPDHCPGRYPSVPSKSQIKYFRREAIPLPLEPQSVRGRL